MLNPDSSIKITFTPELDEALDKLMGNELMPHTCQIFEMDTSSKMKPFGSGIMAFLGGHHYILTAAHVAEHLTQTKPLFIKSRDGFTAISGKVLVTNLGVDKTIDLAYIKLHPHILPALEGGYRFLPISKFRGHSELFYATQYCVFGYPEDSTKEIDGELQSQAEGFFVEPAKEKVYEYYKFDPKTCFILDFKGKGVDVRTGEDKKIKIQPYGLSGCGLWLLLPTHQNEKWTVDYKLIGIMTEFKKGKYYCLIGNKISLVLDALMKVEELKLSTKPVVKE
ncbi:serine protease family protein [Hymenobacter terricola]|uniref:hypothetical protein n=1 Tax=Hymenobacter terricola TaxID=2819236 RepID=UPI001B305032|nr:hypothetical protein [Hymenobacter terricola]